MQENHYSSNSNSCYIVYVVFSTGNLECQTQRFTITSSMCSLRFRFSWPIVNCAFYISIPTNTTDFLYNSIAEWVDNWSCKWKYTCTANIRTRMRISIHKITYPKSFPLLSLIHHSLWRVGFHWYPSQFHCLQKRLISKVEDCRQLQHIKASTELSSN